MADQPEKPKANRGGKRPGAGRKKSQLRDIRDACNKAMDRVVVPQFEAIFESLVNQALGSPGVPPDRVAAMYLVDRYLGRPTQALKVIPKKDLKELSDDALDAIVKDQG